MAQDETDRSVGKACITDSRAFHDIIMNPSTVIDFSKATLVSSAYALIEGSALELTIDSEHERGAAWIPVKISKTTSFCVVFHASMRGRRYGAADGMAFVVQSHSKDAVGIYGCGLGYSGIPRSLAVELDTYCNQDLGDPEENHVSVQTKYHEPNSSDHKYSIGCSSMPFKMSDGTPFAVRVTYLSTQGSLIVEYAQQCSGSSPKPQIMTLNWKKVLVVDVDLAKVLGITDSADAPVWIGFTASTGEVHQEHFIHKASYSLLKE